MTTSNIPVLSIGRHSVIEDLRSIIPVVPIAGTRGKTTVAWMLTDIVSRSGASVGSWLSSGVYVNGSQQSGELGPWKKVLFGASVGELDVVLQELQAPTVLGVGLPENTYPIGVITTVCGNDETCKLSHETTAELRALSVLIEAVHESGVVIATADDFTVVDLVSSSERTAQFFALHRDNPVLTNHLDQGGCGAWVEGSQIFYGNKLATKSVMNTSDIRAAVNGTLTFQVQNALAATCIAMNLGIDPSNIQDALREFVPRIEHQPAACNVFDIHDSKARVVVDAPSKVWPLRMLARGIKRQHQRRTIVVTGCFPAMDDGDAQDAGRIIGGLAEVVVLHSGAAPNSRVNAIREGLLDARIPPIVLAAESEREAVSRLLDLLGTHDVGLILAESTDEIVATLASVLPDVG